MRLTTTLSKLSPSSSRLRVLAATAAVLVLPFSVYYLFYVGSQTAYFTDRSFRSLTLISSQIATRVESASGVLKNAGDKFLSNELKDDSPRFDPKKSRKENLEAIGKMLKSLKEYGPDISATDFEVTGRVPLNPKHGHKSSVTITEVKQEEDSPWVYLEYVYVDDTDKNTQVKIKVRSDLANLVRPVLNLRDNIGGTEHDEFQNILIAEAGSNSTPPTNGRVIFQLDQSQHRLTSLDKLAAADNDEKTIDINSVDNASSVFDVKLAGSTYKLFLQPIELSIPKAEGGNTRNTQWIICGLIPTAAFRKAAWSISYTILILCAFVTSLLVLSWPFLKLVLIGPKDRLRTADVYFLTFSVVVGLGVLTSLALYGYSYLKLDYQMDAQLADLAGNIQSNFKTELRKSLLQLDVLSGNRELLQVLTGSKSQPTGAAKTTKRDIYYEPQRNLDKILPRIQASPDTTYPYFDTAVWIDREGMQKAKWTIKDFTTQYIDVSSRPYFSNLNEGRFRYFDSHKFWLEPIISKTTGRNEVEISQRVDSSSTWIAAFDARLISLMQPVLPNGFGYAIIDKDGKVLFHSDESHHLGENFFQECDDNQYLRSAVYGRTMLGLNVRYLGEGHHLYITPLEGFPNWSLVTFRNKQALRSAFLELLTLLSLLFLGYSLVLLALFSFFYLLNLNTNKRRAWLWPSSDRTISYYVSACLLLILSLVCLCFVLTLHGLKTIAPPVIISLLGLLSFFLNLWFGSYFYEGRLKESFRSTSRLRGHEFAYVLNLSLLLILIAVLPTLGFFKYAYESEMKLFVKHGLATVASALSERDERIRSQYANRWSKDNWPKVDKTEMSQFVKTRQALEWDVYDEFFFKTKHENPAPNPEFCATELPDTFLAYCNKFIPLYNRTSIERRGLLANKYADDTCKWETPEPEKIVFHLSDRETGWPWPHLSSQIPPFVSAGISFWSIFFFVLFLLFTALFLFWIRSIVRTVFLLGVYKPTSTTLRELLDNAVQSNLFVILDVAFTERVLLKSSKLHTVDVMEEAKLPDWAERFNYAHPDILSTPVIAVEHFEYEIDKPPANYQKLLFVENLLKLFKKVVILSTAEAAQYTFDEEQDPEAQTQRGLSDNEGRWITLVSRFFKVYVEDSGDLESFEDEISREQSRILAETDPEARPHEEIEELVRILRWECAPKAPLQQIGLQIIKQGGFAALTREHLLNRIINQAFTYYLDIWTTCSIGEKQTLFHLAQDRLLSYRDPDVGALLRRGLIVRETDIHVMNESFREFVKSDERLALVMDHEKNAIRVSLWHSLKLPLLFILIVITLFLFITQRDLYSSTLAIITAVTTLIPAFFKLLSLFQQDPGVRTGQS